jgi:hypothetical protein
MGRTAAAIEIKKIEQIHKVSVLVVSHKLDLVSTEALSWVAVAPSKGSDSYGETPLRRQLCLRCSSS